MCLTPTGIRARPCVRCSRGRIRNLSAETARAFRLVGIHPGCDFDIGAIAALTGRTLSQARGLANVLHRTHLIQVKGKRRLQMHDLLRTYARSLPSTVDSSAELDAARQRLFSYYLHGTWAALDLIAPQHGTHRPPWLDAVEGVTPILTGAHDAVSWLTAERANLFITSENNAHLADRAAVRHALGLVARQSGDIPQALRHFEYASRGLGAPTDTGPGSGSTRRNHCWRPVWRAKPRNGWTKRCRYSITRRTTTTSGKRKACVRWPACSQEIPQRRENSPSRRSVDSCDTERRSGLPSQALSGCARTSVRLGCGGVPSEGFSAPIERSVREARHRSVGVQVGLGMSICVRSGGDAMPEAWRV